MIYYVIVKIPLGLNALERRLRHKVIDVKNLHKYFGSLEVLKGIDCHIDKGECVYVIGPSGSGKSTFLRCLNLLETPTKGDIVIDDMHLALEKKDLLM